MNGHSGHGHGGPMQCNVRGGELGRARVRGGQLGGTRVRGEEPGGVRVRGREAGGISNGSKQYLVLLLNVLWKHTTE